MISFTSNTFVIRSFSLNRSRYGFVVARHRIFFDMGPLASSAQVPHCGRVNGSMWTLLTHYQRSPLIPPIVIVLQCLLGCIFPRAPPAWRVPCSMALTVWDAPLGCLPMDLTPQTPTRPPYRFCMGVLAGMPDRIRLCGFSHQVAPFSALLTGFSLLMSPPGPHPPGLAAFTLQASLL